MGLVSRKVMNMPLNAGLSFTIFTLLLYCFGPYNYPNFCGFWLYLFLGTTYVFLYFGFKDGLKYKVPIHTDCRPFPILKFLNFLFIISLLVSIPRFYIYSGMPDLSPSFIISRALLFFSDAQELYTEKIDNSISVTGFWRVINWIIVLVSPLRWAYTPLAVIFWKKLSLFQKCGTCFIWFLFALEYLITGTNFGLFDLLISIFVAYIAGRARVNQALETRKVKHPIRYLLLFGILIFILLWIFDTSMTSRMGESFYLGGDVGNKSFELDQNRFLYKITPPALQPLLAYLTNYVARPYSALSLAMTLPFEPTFGVGYSWFFLDNAPFSEFLWSRTFPVRIEELYGYSHTINWHTAYTWFANDISFFLVPFLFYFLFRIFGQAWKEYLLTGNIAAFLLFMIYVKMMFFLSANNQVFQGSSTTIAFWFLFLTRRHFRSYNWTII